MRRSHIAALLRLLVFAGATYFANPYTSEERVDLSQVWVEIPTTLVALGGDVHIFVRGVSDASLRARIAREDDEGRTLLATMPLALDAESRMTIPCGYFSRGGIYYLELVADKEFLEYNFTAKVKRDLTEGGIMETGDSVVKSWKFDVLWPTANLDVTPEQIQTYPERQVTAILEFPKVVCTPVETGADFWLELLYCGHSSGGAVLCDDAWIPWPKDHDSSMRIGQSNLCLTSTVDPCSLAERGCGFYSSIRSVFWRGLTGGQHTASFDCRLFSERYPEYCFVYVSQAVTGAVADVRMDCLPTLPLSDKMQ
ncbi:unnamed protein product [Leptidea sinapis]|uniref:Uncharacterized protein n=1 Tax=Leptidea sinapis TaxID=189913 RepID=A0A5E4QNJ5_9NEOP|nr:unnamed protein product [Leptidea sinapis]